MTTENKFGLTVGCDPEVFVFDTVADRYISAHDLIPGTKAEPHPVLGGAVQVDGMALEFNTDPASTPKEFANNVKKVLNELKGLIPDTYRLAAKPIVEFGEEYMQTVPEEAKELGCEPDFNAYNNGAENPRPNGEATFRTGAGHIHIGWGENMPVDDPEHREVCCVLARQLDFYLGCGLGLNDPDTKRRKLYGDKGSFRPKSYGMEYRPLSNAWLRDEALYEAIPRLVYAAWENLQKNYPDTRNPNSVSKFFKGGQSIGFYRDLKQAISKDLGASLKIHPDFRKSSSGELVEFATKPFDYPFTTADIYLDNFEEVSPYLEQMGIAWADGTKATEYTFDTGYTVELISSKYLRLELGTDFEKVDLIYYLPENMEGKSQADLESKFFI